MQAVLTSWWTLSAFHCARKLPAFSIVYSRLEALERKWLFVIEWLPAMGLTLLL
jgi:hypothetical protein